MYNNAQLNLEIMFVVASIIASAAPVVLFWGGGSWEQSTHWSTIFEGHVHENLIWYFICVFVSSVVLSHSYNVQATRTRKTLLLAR